jgi:hypothetical protein
MDAVPPLTPAEIAAHHALVAAFDAEGVAADPARAKAAFPRYPVVSERHMEKSARP